MSGMFVMQRDGKLVPMNQQPYDSEADLADLISLAPALIPGDQVDPGSPRQWLLVQQEVGVPAEEDGAGFWSLDHLLLDQDGVPTLVEVKRSTDTRIRREVVGQMLDYAANSVAFLPVERIRTMYESRWADISDADSAVTQITGIDEVDDFWSKVKTNLDAGRIRLLFVADRIPPELRRIIEFLNRYTDPVEVLGVEIRQFEGEGIKTLVPQVVGQTVEAKDRKAGRRKPTTDWDEPRFFEKLGASVEGVEVAVARQIFTWAEEYGLLISWGKGLHRGSFTPRLIQDEEPHSLLSVLTNGKIEFLLGAMERRAPFDSQERRFQLLGRINQVPGIDIGDDRIDGWPLIPLADVVGHVDALLGVWTWYLDEVKNRPRSDARS